MEDDEQMINAKEMGFSNNLFIVLEHIFTRSALRIHGKLRGKFRH